MAFANQPAGSTTVTEFGFTSLAFPDRWYYDWPPPIRTDGGIGAYSPPNYARQTFYVGMEAGRSPNNFFYFLEDQGNVRDWYASWFWRPASTTGGWEGGNKINFYSPNPQLFFIVVQLYPVGYWGPWQYAIYFPDLTNSVDNSHLPNSYGESAIGTRNLLPNVYDKPVTFNVFHEIELRAKYSTTQTSRDGIISWWVDGDLVGHHADVNYPGGSSGSYFSEFWFSPTWGNAGQVRTVEGHFDYDHVRLATGGGTTPPPPTPPAAPTNLRFV